MTLEYETKKYGTKTCGAQTCGAKHAERMPEGLLEDPLSPYLAEMRCALDQFCQKQETKVNQLWAAIGGANGPSQGLLSQEFPNLNTNQNTHIKGMNTMNTYNTQNMMNTVNTMNTVAPDLGYANGLGYAGDDLRAFIKTGLQTKSLSTADESGAYMVPSPVQEQINRSLLLSGSIRTLARVSSISSDALEVMLDADTSEVGWVSEKGDRDETKAPTLNRQRIFVHELYSKPMISQKLLDDAAINLDAWLVDNIAFSMNRLENAGFVNGDGDGKPKGFLNYERVPVGEGVFGKIEGVKTGKKGGIDSIEPLYNVIEAMKPIHLDGAVWYMSRSAITHLRRLKTKDGLPIWQPSVMHNQPDVLLGYPVVVSDDMPAVREDTACTPIVLANFKKAYQVVDRNDMRLLRDPYSSKPFVEFYATKRVGGDVIDFEAIKTVSFEE